MDVSVFLNILKPFGIIILFFGISGLYLNSKAVSFERILAGFKIVFYGFLIYLSLWLNVEIINDEVEVSNKLAKELSLGQLLVVAISILEIGSNLVTLLKLPPSEFKFINREEYREDKSDRRNEIMELNNRIYSLEKINEKNPE